MEVMCSSGIFRPQNVSCLDGLECGVQLKKMDVCFEECLIGNDINVPMIPCGLCDRWFHIQCLGLPEGSPRCIRGLYFCSECLAYLKDLRSLSKVNYKNETRLEAVETFVKALNVEQALLRESLCRSGLLRGLEDVVASVGDVTVDSNYAALLRESARLKRELANAVTFAGDHSESVITFPKPLFTRVDGGKMADSGDALTPDKLTTSCCKTEAADKVKLKDVVYGHTAEVSEDTLTKSSGVEVASPADRSKLLVAGSSLLHRGRRKKPCCPHCSKTFTKRGFLLRHIMAVHPTQYDETDCPYSCEKCGMKFFSANTKYQHKEWNRCMRLTVHELPNDLDNPDIPVHFVSKSGEPPSDENDKEDSSVSRTRAPSGFQGSPVDSEKASKGHSISKKIPFKCHLCSFAYPWWNGLQHHLVSKHRVQCRYRCSLCPQEFNRCREVGRHRRELHDGDGRSQKFFISVDGSSDSKAGVRDVDTTSTTHGQSRNYESEKGKNSADRSVDKERVQGSMTGGKSDKSHVAGRKKIRCPHCSVVLSSEGFLLNHMKRKHPEQYAAKVCPYSCKKCGHKFGNLKALSVHNYSSRCSRLMFKKLNADRRVVKDYSGSIATNKATKSDAAKSKNVRCPHCSDVLSSDGFLLYHMRIKHPQEYATKVCPYSCKACGYKFCNLKTLKLHKCRSNYSKSMSKKLEEKSNSADHPVAKKDQGLIATENPNRRDVAGRKNVRCPHCSDVLFTEGFLLHHMRIKHPQQYDAKVCPYSCKKCGCKFINLNSYLFHKYQSVCSVGKNIRKLRNDVGGTKGAVASPLKKGDSSKVRSEQCQHCNNVFFSEGYLLKHMKRMHPRQYATKKCPYSCQKCGLKFMNPSSLAKHKYLKKCFGQKISKRSRLGKPPVVENDGVEVGSDGSGRVTAANSSTDDNSSRKRNVRCPHCNEMFFSDGFLLVHQRVKHPREYASNDCPHACQACGMKFMSRMALYQHRYKTCPVRRKTPIAHRTMKRHHLKFLPPSTKFQQNPSSCFVKENKENAEDSTSYYARTVGPIHKCHLCKFASRKFEHVKRHLEGVHQQKLLYGCPVCQAAFELCSDLRLHQTKFHDGYFGLHYMLKKITSSESVQCQLCPFARWFVTSESLLEHTKYSHNTRNPTTEETSHRCNTCGHNFSTVEMLCHHQTRGCPVKDVDEASWHIGEAAEVGIQSLSSEGNSEAKAIVSVSEGNAELEAWAPFYLLDTEMMTDTFLDQNVDAEPLSSSSVH